MPARQHAAVGPTDAPVPTGATRATGGTGPWAAPAADDPWAADRPVGSPGDPAVDRVEDPDADPESVARAICLRQLTMAPRSRAQLAEALARRAVPAEAARQVLDRLSEVGLVDDAAFAQAWVRSRHTGRGLARRALAEELRRKGIDAEVAAEALAGLDTDDERRAARALVDRRLAGTRGLDRDRRVRRLAGMLARKGYSSGLALRVVSEALAAEGQDGRLDGEQSALDD